MLKPLIVFSGPDGAGKTTLAKILATIISRHNKVKIVRIRGTHTVAYLIAMFLRSFKAFRGKELHYYKIQLPRKLKNAWLWIELFSVTPLVILYYYLYRLRYIVISERGPLDMFIWLVTGLNLKTEKLLKSLPLRVLLLWTVKFNTIYIRADKSVLLARKPKERSLIESSFALYESVAETLKLKSIDTTSGSPYECVKPILETIPLGVHT